MNKKQKYFLVIGIILIAAALLYWFTQGAEILTKTQILVDKTSDLDKMLGVKNEQYVDKLCIWLTSFGDKVSIGNELFCFTFRLDNIFNRNFYLFIQKQKKGNNMKKSISIFAAILFFTASLSAQGFKVEASGEQTFNLADKNGRNQATFFSTTPLEDITGLGNDISGTVTFNVNDIKTLKGKVSVSVASIKTGIDTRDGHMRGAGWLNAEAFPEISFDIKKVSDIKSVADNKLTAKVNW